MPFIKTKMLSEFVCISSSLLGRAKQPIGLHWERNVGFCLVIRVFSRRARWSEVNLTSTVIGGGCEEVDSKCLCLASLDICKITV